MTIYPLQPLDNTALILTVGAVSLSVICLIVLFVLFRRRPMSRGRMLVQVIVALAIIAPFAFAYAWSPSRIVVTSDSVILQSPLAHREVPLSSIEEVRFVRGSEVEGAYRTFGVGGLFGYFGEFRSDGLGSFTMFSTSQQNNVEIATRNGYVVASPASPDSFIAELNSRINRAKP